MAMILAEAGTNHAADTPHEVYMNAINLARWAKHCGADAVKFQLFLPDEPLFCPMEGDEKRWHRWSRTHISDWLAVKQYCDDLGIELILSAFQNSGVELVNELGLRHKVASRAAENYPYSEAHGQIIVSCGAVNPVTDKPVRKLQCIMEYPCPPSKSQWEKDLNPDWGPHTNGLSDHSGTIWPAIDALSRGAEIIEVHFRPVLFEPGPDAAVELTCEQLKMICEARDAFKEMRGE